MATINTGSLAKALWPGVNDWYGLAYNEYPEECKEIFETRSSRKAFEEIMGISGMGLAAVKPEGQPVTYDSAQQAFLSRFNHVVYALGFVITKEMFEDDQYDVIAQIRSRSLAKSMRITKETVGANVLNRGFNSSYTGGDSKELLATDHPHYAGGVFANELSTAANLSEAALEQACIDLGKFEDDKGLRIAVRPQKLILPVDLQFEAERILNTDMRVATADNDLNAVKSLGKIPQGFRINHYLTSDKAWFLQTDCDNGMIHFERRGDEFTMDNDFDTDNAKYKASGRYSFGWADPRGIFGSPGV